MAKSSFYGQVLHFGFVGMRVTGSGNLKSELLSLDEIISNPLADIPMLVNSATEPILISNLTSQRGKLHLFTDEFDATFRITRIVIYVKPVAASLPR